jgi:hypothetical protein
VGDRVFQLNPPRGANGAKMDQELRLELEKVNARVSDRFGDLHMRVDDLRSRLVHIEAQDPHINATLARMERTIDGLKSSLMRVVWLLVAMAVGTLWKIITDGNIPGM